jgi:hypothetical protein
VKKIFVQFFVGLLLLVGFRGVYADLTCYGQTSTTSYFACFSTGNCVWWAAFKRPDIAAVIGGGGWGGGQWYDKLQGLGFSVGQEPKDGAVVEFSSPGHVAFIEKTHADGSFDVSEMDSTGQLGNGGVYYATYYPDGNNTYHRNSGTRGGWKLKGFIYSGRAYNLTIYHAGNVGWYPLVDICQNANRWYRLSQEDGKTIADPANKNICNEVIPQCYAQ